MKLIIFTFGNIFVIVYILKISLGFLDFEGSICIFLSYLWWKTMSNHTFGAFDQAYLEERVAGVWWRERDLIYYNILGYKWYLEDFGLQRSCWVLCQGIQENSYKRLY